jgi:Protein of unknown function (DUF1643)
MGRRLPSPCSGPSLCPHRNRRRPESDAVATAQNVTWSRSDDGPAQACMNGHRQATGSAAANWCSWSDCWPLWRCYPGRPGRGSWPSVGVGRVGRTLHVGAGQAEVAAGRASDVFSAEQWKTAETATAALREHFSDARLAEETSYGVLLVPDPVDPGFAQVTVLNLFAIRAPRPGAVHRLPEPVLVGPANDVHIRSAARRADVLVAPWGRPQRPRPGDVRSASPGRPAPRRKGAPSGRWAQHLRPPEAPEPAAGSASRPAVP